MVVVIATKQDLASVTRILCDNPHWTYDAYAGDYGTLVLNIRKG